MDGKVIHGAREAYSRSEELGGLTLRSLKMAKPRPLRVRIVEAQDKLERLRDLERLEKIRERMTARKAGNRRRVRA